MKKRRPVYLPNDGSDVISPNGFRKSVSVRPNNSNTVTVSFFNLSKYSVL